MNRQALAFLSLFSLILMLSVYYVTLPPVSNTVIKSENKNEDLQSQINKDSDDEIKKNSDILSSGETSEKEKQEAIQKMELLKKQKEQIETWIKACKEAGYECSIEIIEKVMKVTIHNSEKSKETAKKVMDLLLKESENKFFIEISFK